MASIVCLTTEDARTERCDEDVYTRGIPLPDGEEE